MILSIILVVGIILIIGPKFLFEFNVIVYRIFESKIGRLPTAFLQVAFSGILALLLIYLWRLSFICVFKYAYSKMKGKTTS
jgi:hypothetical protein